MFGSRQKWPRRTAAEELFPADAAGAKAGPVERVPEGHRLESAGRATCDLERDLNGIRSTGGKQHLGQRWRTDVRELLR